MGEVEDMEREVAAEVYRGMAFRMRIQAGLLNANAESLEQAAERIANGEAEVNTLRLVEAEAEEEREPEPRNEQEKQEQDRAHWRSRKRRVLDAAVAAAVARPADPLAAAYPELMDRAAFDPDDAEDFTNALRELQAAELIETHRIRHPSSEAMPLNVYLPTAAGLRECDIAFPQSAVDERATLMELLTEGPTREMAPVGDGAEAGDH